MPILKKLWKKVRSVDLYRHVNEAHITKNEKEGTSSTLSYIFTLSTIVIYGLFLSYHVLYFFNHENDQYTDVVMM